MCGRRASVLAAAIALTALCLAQATAEETWRAQVQADWLLQDKLRSDSNPLRQPTTREDARGGVDGVKNGKWAFHTDLQADPWWQVDLGAAMQLDHALVYNRCDGCQSRASRLKVLLSDDGKTWREVYQHNGKAFYGHTDNKPLVVPLKGERGRWLRVQLPSKTFLHLDEVEVYGDGDRKSNLALGRLADQSSVSRWSVRHLPPEPEVHAYPVKVVIARGLRLAKRLAEMGLDTTAAAHRLSALHKRVDSLTDDSPESERRGPYMEARWTVRQLALRNPLLDFDRILFAKRKPSQYSHMSDQYYGWWSRPGGGLYVIDGFRHDAPRVRCLDPRHDAGNVLRPDLSHDGQRVLFAYCKHYPHLAGLRNKVDKSQIPEDAFYHVFEMRVDGTGLRQLTRGRYDDFDARYLPNGDIVFLSTRRGQSIQCGRASAEASTRGALPDCYVRCGGGASRPVAVYTLHVMDGNGGQIRAISPFENFEWTPSVAHDGRVLYARWDYVDRHNMPYMSLWSTNRDGTNPQAVYGNFTRSPHCIFEARQVPGSHKIVFTASAHHAITGGSLALLDPYRGPDGKEPIERLTPEVRFPEIEGWPKSYYANPLPLSEDFYLVAWSPQPVRKQGRHNPENALGIYLFDRFGNLELLHRDPAISCMYPLPLRARPRPGTVASAVAWDQPGTEGALLVQDVYQGLAGVKRGAVKRLRIVAVPAKTQPQMNRPRLGVTRDDPGKCVLGTAPVCEDGSAHFRLPAGVAVFLQALDGEGLAVQTMRTVTYVQPGQTLSCVGCHEPRHTTPVNARSAAAGRPASRLTPGPEGSWPLRFDQLVQPVLDRHCVRCHCPGGQAKASAKLNLTPPKAYDALVLWGKPSLKDHVSRRYREGRSQPGACVASQSRLLAMLRGGHQQVKLSPADVERVVTWMDTYAQERGSFSPEQEKRLAQLRVRMAPLLAE